MLLRQNQSLPRLSELSNGSGRKNYFMCKEANPFLKYDARNEPMAIAQGEAVHDHGMPCRHRVRIVSKRVRLCDPDNLIGGVKHLVDYLRYAKIIPEDDPTAITLEVTQEKVKGYKYEETWVEVSR